MLDLTTPKVRNDPRLAGEFRPRTLESWLAQLPRTDRESCWQQLHKALATQNRVALDPALRLQLMELYLAPFIELYTLHRSELRTLSRVPLHPHFRARQEDMLDRLDAMATGYKIAALDLVSGRRGHGREAGLALALQRAMHWLGEVLVTAYELYVRPPGGAWREVHELYGCAEASDLCKRDVEPLPGDAGPVSVIKTYVPILLLGAGSPYGLLPGEARRLYELAPQWRRSARISTPTELPADPGYFVFNLGVDAPPYPASKSIQPVDGGTRLLRTLGAARAMHQTLTDLNDATTRKAMRKVLGPSMQMTDTELFRRLGKVFGEVDIKRNSKRFPVHQGLELHAGFDPAFTACNDGRSFDPAAWMETGTAAGEAPAGQSDEQFIDLSEPMLGTSIAGDRPPPLAAAPRRLPQASRGVNQSAGGLCLVVPRARELRVKVGDIAACRFAEASEWQLGVVRWLRIAAKEVRIGLQFLGPSAVPLAAFPDAGAPGNGRSAPEGPAVAAIWLPENPALKQAHSVVLPRATEPYPAFLEIRGPSDGPQRVRLLRRVECTGDYEQFLVSVDPSGPDPTSSRSS